MPLEPVEGFLDGVQMFFRRHMNCRVRVRGATQKFPKFECRAKTACSTVVGL
jgi:hypothetical protein